jgi:hypothetical protein
MNKEELLKEFEKKVEQARNELIAKLEDKKEFELIYPEKDYWGHCVDSDTGEIIEVYYTANNITDRFLFEHGYYFETKQEAEQHLKERKLLFKLHQWAKEKNDGWEPDWEDGVQRKVYITYYKTSKGYFDFADESTWTSNRFSKLPYFKTIELAQKCIDLFGDEIKEVLV